MQTTYLPVSATRETDKMKRNFLWGSTEEKRKVHLLNWDKVCKPKNMGGLGLREARDMNIALLSKLVWKVETGDSGPWAKLLKEKYFGTDAFLRAKTRTSASHTWRSICSYKSVLTKGISKIIGDGSSTSFWHERWIGDKPLALVMYLLNVLTTRFVTSYLQMFNGIGRTCK